VNVDINIDRFSGEPKDRAPYCPPHEWRLIECKDGIDTLKCVKCGQEKTEPCSFDEEYS
jgi:hypothetical protein